MRFRLLGRAVLGLCALLAVTSAPAMAQQAPSDAQLVLGRQIVVGSGLSRSFEGVIPSMLAQINNAITRTRPEVAADLKVVIAALETEFSAQTSVIIDRSAKVIAAQMTEAEMKDIVAFFNSASGKKYVQTQPQTLDAIVNAIDDWRKEVSNAMSDRIRAEMKKKGHSL